MNNGLIRIAAQQDERDPARLFFPNMVAFIGDSITQQGGTKTALGQVVGGGGAFTGISWPQWFAYLSQGRFLIGHIAALTGRDSGYARAFLLPEVLASPVKHGYCVVLQGTNDIWNTPAVPLDATKKNLMDIWTQLEDAGIVPILCTLPPQDTALYNQQHRQLSAFIRTAAARYGWPLIDFGATLTNESTGAWAAGYSDDGTHPNKLGSQNMGQVAANACTDLWGPTGLNVVTSTAESMNLINTTNAIMLTDSNADGVPNGWTLTGSGATCGIAAASGIIGNQATVTSSTTDTLLESATFSLNAGDIIEATVKLESSACSANLLIRTVNNSATTGDVYSGWDVPVASGSALPAGVLRHLVRVPASVTGVSRFYLYSTTTGRELKIGQPTAFNVKDLY